MSGNHILDRLNQAVRLAEHHKQVCEKLRDDYVADMTWPIEKRMDEGIKRALGLVRDLQETERIVLAMRRAR